MIIVRIKVMRLWLDSGCLLRAEFGDLLKGCMIDVGE